MKYKMLLTIFLVAIIASAILAFVPISNLCAPNDNSSSGCSFVQSSTYSKILGVNNSYIGLVAFIALFFITLSHMFRPRKEKELVILVGVVIASLLAIYFIYLQVFILKAFCTYCMIVDVLSILALVIVGIYGMD
ncbi:MAG: vitamin K epoxide reductase family protein [archaeon]|nr:vitamin K epoxide reductase family protein [archaeon]